MIVTTFPSNPKEGDLVYRSDLLKYFTFTNSLWVETPAATTVNTNSTYHTDTTTTGSNASITFTTSPYLMLTNSSLVSIAMIKAGIDGQPLTVTNLTGNTISILNDTGATLANRIITNLTPPTISLVNNSDINFVYKLSDARWEVVGYGTLKGSGIHSDTSNNISNIGTVYSGSSAIDDSAVIQLDSINKGILPPRMTTIQRNAIPTPLAGLVIYNTSTNSLNTFNGAIWTSTEGNPIGTILDFAGSTAPTGYLLCGGQAISRVDYSDLFTIIGTSFGVGNGTTTFNVPDLRGRVVAGLDNMNGTGAGRLTSGGSGIPGTILGSTGVGGVETVTLTSTQSGSPSHNHTNTQTDLGHHHLMFKDENTLTVISAAGQYATTMQAYGSAGREDSYRIGAASGVPNVGSTSSVSSGVFIDVDNSTAVDAATYHTNVQPTIVLNKIIKF